MFIPIPTDEDEPPLIARSIPTSAEWCRKINEFFAMPSWKCLECKTTMHGTMQYCVYCKLKLGKHTSRPEE